MKEKHVKHVLTAQKDILSLSNNFTKYLDKNNRAERADSNLPVEDIKKIDESRKYDANIVRQIAQTVTKMRKDMTKMEEQIQKLSDENKEMSENCKKKHQIEQTQTEQAPVQYNQHCRTGAEEEIKKN